MNTIANQTHERVNIITAIINKKQAVNRVKFSSDRIHAEFNKLYSLPLSELFKLSSK